MAVAMRGLAAIAAIMLGIELWRFGGSASADASGRRLPSIGTGSTSCASPLGR
jgi:hypothetical protein